MRLGTDSVHHAWDNSLPPALEIEGSGIVELDLLDSGGAQLDAGSGASDLVVVANGIPSAAIAVNVVAPQN